MSELVLWPWRCFLPSRRGLDRMARHPLAWRHGDAQEPALRLVLLGDLMTVWGGAPLRVSAAIRRMLAGADLVLANLETPLCPPGRRPERKVLRHRMTPDTLSRLLEAFELEPSRLALSLANNHAGDDGPAGVASTADLLGGIGVTAVGVRRAEAAPVEVLAVGGVRLGVVAWTHWLNRRPFPAAAGVWRTTDIVGADWRQLRQRPGFDLLLGYPHWEHEFCLAPRRETRALAGWLASSGFDLVAGHHPHVAQPLEWFGRAPVFYSLGGFHGPLPWLSSWRHRLAWGLEVELDETVIGYRLRPLALQRVTEGHELVELEESVGRARLERLVREVFS